MARLVANSFPDGAGVEHIDNPRLEVENHYYKFMHTPLESFGLEPHLLGDTLLSSMYGLVEQHRDRGPQNRASTGAGRSTRGAV